MKKIEEDFYVGGDTKITASGREMALLHQHKWEKEIRSPTLVEKRDLPSDNNKRR